MSTIHKGERIFRIEREPIEATSLSRPNTSWYFIDRAGHLHQWWIEKPFRPADHYSPSTRYIVPSTEHVKVGEQWIGDEFDGSVVGIYENQCRKCGEAIRHGYKADDYRQHIPGLRSLYVDDVSVTPAEFKRLAIEEGFPESAFPEGWE